MKLTPKQLGLPIEEWRPGQWEAILNSHKSNKKFVGQCAPTGSGKSAMLIGESRLSNKRTLILTGTKHLQTQYSKEYPNIVDVRGKANYRCIATELGGEFYDGSAAKSVAEAPCQFGIECSLKLYGCTYYDKLRAAASAKLVVANYAAWISANMYTDGWGHFPLIMCDEAHEAEGWLASMLAVKVPIAYEDILGCPLPVSDEPKLWAVWATNKLIDVKWELSSLKEVNSKRRKHHHKSGLRIKALQMVERVLRRIKIADKDWIVIRSKDHVLLHPVWVMKYSNLIFNRAEKVVFASSTIVPKTLHMLGVPNADLDFFSYPSQFPIERRPIYYYPVTKMCYGMEEEDDNEWIKAGDEFISKRLDRKGFIPVPSFSLAQRILKGSQFAGLMVTNTRHHGGGDTSASLLKKFKDMPPPAILLTPSMGTGVDLSFKTAEYVWVPKMPFGNKNDPMLLAREESDPDYGVFNCAVDLVQLLGRAMRDEKDQMEALITDSVFQMFRTKYRHFIPQWVWDAVKKVDELPEPLEAL